MIDDSVMIPKKIHASEEESNAECTFPKEIIGISCFSQPIHRVRKTQGNHKEINGFRDARTIFKQIAIV